MLDKNIQNFSRYEFKYIINNNIANKIENEISIFSKIDSNVTDKENYYFVNSLYFENLQNVNFYEKIDGIKKRKKFRLRTYSEYFDFQSPIFLELKGKNNQRTYKERTLVEKKEDLDVLLYYSDIYNKKQFIDNKVYENFFYEKLRKLLIPQVFIEYKRKPYTQNSGLFFRLTFDYDIKATKFHNTQLNKKIESTAECLSGYTVLEVKFDRSIPAWFHRIIQCYDLERLSISKFVVGMKVCQLAIDLS